tara:strand:+ start:66 stop:212 length:147 start_codon:yes stop_codon:yes gene_type:complete
MSFNPAETATESVEDISNLQEVLSCADVIQTVWRWVIVAMTYATTVQT